MRTEVIEVCVYIPSVEEFAASYPHYGRFARNEGKFIFDLIMSPESYIRARVATVDLDLPAVAGVAESCYQVVDAHPIGKWDYIKQFIGAVVCVLMEANGFEKTGTKKAIPHQKFTKGEFYRKRDG